MHSNEWKEYVSHLESIIEDGLKFAVKTSLQYLHDNTDSSSNELFPFYKITLLLEEDIVFKPPLDVEEPGNFIKLFEDVVEEILSLGKDINRITDPQRDYAEFLENDEELKSVLNSLKERSKDGVDKIMQIMNDFDSYKDLWQLNIDEELENFALHGLVPEEKDGEDIEDEIKPPTEDEFKTEISNFNELYKIVHDLENIIKVESWLILDITLFKDSLLGIIRKWQSSYRKKFNEMKHSGLLRKLQVKEDM